MSTGQLNWRTQHSTILVRNKLYCWGGDQKDLPKPLVHVHGSEDKRKTTSTVNIFELSTFKWERKSTTSNPHAGVLKYACTNIMNSIFYFGGSCKPVDRFHNNLYELNTLTLNWNEIIATTTDNIPMRKHGCGMTSFNMNGEDHLFLSGGVGPTPLTKQKHAEYIPSPMNPNLSYTNEIHCMNVSTSPGQWIVPVITGTRPPPLAYSTINTLPGNRGVMFGGQTFNERNRHYHINDVYIFQYSDNTIDFQKIVQSEKWPKGRIAHTTSIINSISSNQQVMPHLITIGGMDDDLQLLNDSWILNMSSLIWYQINLPESVSKRYHHSLTTYPISNNRVWIIINGGIGEYDRCRGRGIPVTGCDVTVIVELEYINEEWIVKHVWNNEQLMNNKIEIHKSLIHHIVDDRLQEGTLVMKSPFTTPQQLETQRILEKKIFKKESELLKLSVEMREKSDEITHLKTREVSLIDKSDTLEKGFSKDETQAYKKMAITTRHELNIERRMPLIKSQELDFSRKQLKYFIEKLKLTSTLSPDEEDMEIMEVNKDYQKTQEREPLEEEKSKPVDDDKSLNTDKILILQEENESLQMIVASKNEQVEELHSMLQTKKERMKELESILEQVITLQTTITNKSSQVEELQSMLEIERDQLKQLKVQMEEFKKIDELRISSSHDSEVIKYQRDAAVQFSYMIPVTDHLDGVHVAGETLFLIQGDKPQSLNWEEYGLRLHFPQGAISPSDTCEVVVKVLVGGKFQFPEGTELVSAVYAVAFAKKLLEPVEMEIQHCVNLTNEEQGKYLSFVSTANTHRHDPNKFEFVEGGVFSPGKRYASIQRIHCCKNAIVEDTTPPPPPPPSSQENESSGDDDDSVKEKPQAKGTRSYTGQMYYVRTGFNRWLAKLMIIRDVNAFMKYVEVEHSKDEKDEMIRFQFIDPVNGYIELDMNIPQERSVKGWTLVPHKRPLRPTKRDADLFGSQELLIPPSCLITVWGKITDDTEDLLSYTVGLNGIDSDTKEICINRFLETSSSTTVETTSHKTPQSIDIPVNTSSNTASSLSDVTGQDPFNHVCYCVLGIDDLNEVFDTCKEFSKDWKFIGLKLWIKKTTLDNIKKDCDDVKEMMLEMLASWLKRECDNQPVPSWNILLTTLSEYDRTQTKQIASKFVCKHVK